MFLNCRLRYIGVKENGMFDLTGGLKTKNTVAPFTLCRPANIQDWEFDSAVKDGIYYWTHRAKKRRSAHLYPRHLCIPSEWGVLGEGTLYYPLQNNLSSEGRTGKIRQEEDIRGRRPSSLLTPASWKACSMRQLWPFLQASRQNRRESLEYYREGAFQTTLSWK